MLTTGSGDRDYHPTLARMLRSLPSQFTHFAVGLNCLNQPAQNKWFRHDRAEKPSRVEQLLDSSVARKSLAIFRGYNARMGRKESPWNNASPEPLRNKVMRAFGPAWTTRLRCIVKGRGLPWWGNLRRVKPFSNDFGWDRGTPVDRYYVDRFFERHQADITGDVLEIDRNTYTHRYGHDLGIVHSVDIDPKSDPTFLCDIAHCENILPSEAYDCFLLPCTLQHFRELELCLRNVLRVVKPGGVILANAAGLFRLDKVGLDFWRPTPDGWRELLQRVWPDCTVVVEAEGNCLAVVAINLGLALEELKPEELDYHDARFPVVTNIYCRKAKR